MVDYNKVELTKLEEIKLAMLYDAIKNEAQYCFDIAYRNDMTYQERIDGFLNHANYLTEQTIQGLVEDHGSDFFECILDQEQNEIVKKLIGEVK